MTQRMDALALANERRCAQAAYRHEISAMSFRAGTDQLAEGFKGTFPTETEYDRVDRVVLSAKRMGPRAFERLLRRCALPAGRQRRRIRELTPYERGRIANELRLSGCS